MNLSTEQLKLLAKFLGLPEEDAEIFVGESGDTGPLIQTKAYQVRTDAYVAFKDFGNWLNSNDGQCALMDAIEENGYAIFFRSKQHAVSLHAYCGDDYSILLESDFIATKQDTRAEALIAAVLRMLEGNNG